MRGQIIVICRLSQPNKKWHGAVQTLFLTPGITAPVRFQLLTVTTNWGAYEPVDRSFGSTSRSRSSPRSGQPSVQRPGGGSHRVVGATCGRHWGRRVPVSRRSHGHRPGRLGQLSSARTNSGKWLRTVIIRRYCEYDRNQQNRHSFDVTAPFRGPNEYSREKNQEESPV